MCAVRSSVVDLVAASPGVVQKLEMDQVRESKLISDHFHNILDLLSVNLISNLCLLFERQVP